MIAEQLKRSILQAAIQGNLTEQLPEDGDAKNLLNEIQKGQPLSEISEEGLVFDIPNNWCWAKLGEVFEIARGGSPRPIEAFLTTNKDGINWIKIGDTDIGGKYIKETKEKIKPEGLKKSRLVHPGDLLLTNSMSFGRPYILNIKGCIHDGWLVLSPRSEKLNKEYFFYLLSSEFIHMAFEHTVAGAVVKNLNSDKVRVISVPLPPAEEQKRIVDCLEKILPGINILKDDESKLDVLQRVFPKKMKDSILRYAFEGKLTEQLESDGDAKDLFKVIQKEKARLIKEGKIKKEKPLPEIMDDEIPFDIPKNWSWVRLNDVLNFVDYRGMTPKKVSNGVRLITANNIKSGFMDMSLESFITEKDYFSRNSRGITKKGDILFTTEAPLGHCCINEFEVCSCGQRIITMQEYGQSEINKNYLMYSLLSPYFQKAILGNRSGMTAKGIKAKKLKLIVIPLPPVNEQKRIVERLDKILLFCDSLD